MGYKVVWTRRAEAGYKRIVDYLLENWTEREVRNFLAETRKFISLLEKNPGLLEQSKSRKNLYRGPLNRLTIVTYRLRPRLKRIELVNVRSARQKPSG
jgi:plasmid stabilization system protein ParE